MAPTFPNTFSKDSPMSPQSGSSTPISYKADVNRQKTKKWTQAPAVDYGGDDWGDDEYDLPPPPVSKPTGLRQQGQGLPAAGDKKAYGELPPLPSANNPRARSNSFDADEERNFSSGTTIQPSSASTAASSIPATRFSQITGQPSTRNSSGTPLSVSTQQAPPTGLRKASNAIPPVVEETSPVVQAPARQSTNESFPSSSVYSRSSTMDARPETQAPVRQGTGESFPSSSVYSTTPTTETRGPSSDFQTRRDFSPSAVPQPLAPRTSLPAQSADAPVTRFPGRKSSLSQMTGPDLDTIVPRPQDVRASSPWSAARSASPGVAGQSTTTPASPPRFIRPADLYRRAEEERQSMESGRPSMDSVLGSRSETSDPSAKPLRGRSSSDSLGGNRKRTNSEGDDSSETGRRLMPMLEPVRERKSEYGFDGFNVNDHTEKGENTTLQASTYDPEKAKRLSTSPKLPDLNRMSGFGIDMFGPSQSEESDTLDVKENENDLQPSITADKASAEEEPSLHSQPSLGFRSVVNQAFDRRDDSSVPPTPASKTGSDVRRTDSQSTDTTGISPIMSRASSSAAASNAREYPNPSIPEAINEQSQPESILEQPQPIASGFKPGHRRDLSTPSPGNSPARTPEIAAPSASTEGQQASMSAPGAALDMEEPLQPPRPITGREDSFRPSLPGGWTSYATTARSNTPPVDTQRSHSEDPSTPRADTVKNEPLDITPTTTKHSLPESALGAAVIGASVGAAALENNDESSPTATAQPESQAIPSASDVLLSASPMGPSGDGPSAATLDPVLPPLEKAPQETQLRPDVVHRPVSAETEDTQTTPPKDTPQLEITNANSDSFPGFTNDETPDLGAAKEKNLPASTAQVEGNLDPDAATGDDLNDQLEQDIVRSLSPRGSDIGQNRQSMLSVSDRFDDNGSYGAGRESTYLPSEYDNYWASTNDGIAPIPAVASASRERPSSSSAPLAAETSQVDNQTPQIAPLNARKAEQASLEPPRPSLAHRFSWERSTESIPLQIQEKTVDPSNVHDTSAPYNAGSSQEPVSSETVKTSDILPTGATGESPANHDHTGKDAALLAGGAASAGAVAAAVNAAKNTSSQESRPRGFSLAEEKELQESPRDDHPSLQPVSAGLSSEVSAPSTVSPISSPVKQQTPQTANFMAFTQIAAIKSTEHRIQTFNETRDRFAALDSGLSDWIMALKAQYPEHSEVSGSWAGSRPSVPNNSARSKLGVAAPTQQPYYQQYLNASSPNTPSSPSRPGSSIPPTAGQQSFSPGGSSGSKLTSQQVQAKGKELLHTAGIFGGKAGKAGKGLLAKGKNKLRGAGGDKASPESKPRSERRSSWGLALTKSRSSSRPPTSRDLDEQDEAMPLGRGPRTVSMPPMPHKRTSAPPQLSIQTDTDTFGPPLWANRASLPISRYSEQYRSPETNNEDSDVPKEGVSDMTISTPLTQPQSYTPTAEEQVINADGRPKNPTPFSAAMQYNPLTIPPPPPIPQDRNEITFYDASETPIEPPEELKDWVMVSPGAPKEASPQHGVTEPQQAGTLVPPPSVLNRPRGSTLEDISPPAPASISTFPTTAVEPGSLQQTPIEAVSPEQSKSSFLPPIRRTSAFGIGIGSRQKKPRFPIDDDDEGPSPDIAQGGFGGGPAPIRRMISGKPRPDSEAWPMDERNALHQMSAAPPVPAIPRQTQAMTPSSIVASPSSIVATPSSLINHPDRNSYQRAIPSRSESKHSEANQNASSEHIEHSLADKELERGILAAQLTENSTPRRSQDSWRPNANVHPALVQQQQPPDQPTLLKRNSWGPLRARGMSGSSQDAVRSRENHPDRPPSTQMKPFDQPPSSAQRYPELFRPDQGAQYNGGQEYQDLPSHHYQQPIPHEAAGLPRQNTNEYQLPGVGPPDDEPNPKAKRNSFLGRMSRASSRERRNSMSQVEDDDFVGYAPQAPSLDSRKNDYAGSIVTASEDGKDSKKQRAGFLKHLKSGSTSGLGPPRSRESTVAHNAGSRVDLLDTRGPSPVPPEKKRGLFGSSSSDLRSNGRKGSETLGVPEGGKKKRFSGLTGLSSILKRPEAANSRTSVTAQRGSAAPHLRQSSITERPSMDAPNTAGSKSNIPAADYNAPPSNYKPPVTPSYPARTGNYQPIAIDQYQPKSPKSPPPATGARGQSATRGIMERLQSNKPSLSVGPRKLDTSRTRKTSAAGLLNGIMGRKSQQSDRERSDSHSQGSQSQTGRHFVPAALTYTDLQEEGHFDRPAEQQVHRAQTPPGERPAPRPPKTQKHIPWQDPAYEAQQRQAVQRGRRTSREPQYDSVPIPGGYDLVRGQGNQTAPTNYDPRGFNHAQQAEPRYGQQQQQQQPWPQNQYPSPPMQGQQQQYFSGQSQTPQHLNTPPPHQQQFRTPSPQQTLSPPSGALDPRQNRLSNLGPIDPYHRKNSASEDLLARSPARVAEDQQPPYQLTLPDALTDDEDRPLSEDPEKDNIIITTTAVNHNEHPALQPQQGINNNLDVRGHQHSLSVESRNPSGDLDRSNTRRTAVSAVSNLSQSEADVSGAGNNDNPADRNNENGNAVKTTVLEQHQSINSNKSEDNLYDASPRLPQNQTPTVIPPTIRAANADADESEEGRVELDNTDQERYRKAREEKIFYGGPEEGEAPVTMSATSYPGQEWHPYMGAYDEGFD